jgi:UDP-N-acetylmuramate--alanine ligase
MKKSTIADYTSVYFVGIGGIGMSALARYFHALGKKVAGYDKTETRLTNALQEEGITVLFEDDMALLNQSELPVNDTLIVYTPAIPSNNNLLQFFKAQGYDLYKRAAVLGMISQNYFTIAIAGTHGKTTSSSMTAHLLKASTQKIIAFLGGIDQNSSTNMLFEQNPKLMITEADEYDKSFLSLKPNIALLTSIDSDHLDIYGSETAIQETYKDFVKLLQPDGWLITKTELKQFFNYQNTLTYGEQEGDYHSQSLTIQDGNYHFTLVCPDVEIENCSLQIGGRHNLENAIGAAAIAHKVSMAASGIREALANYTGVKRRFEVHFKSPKRIYIDDYAHHPSEITACIKAVRELYPNRTLHCIFQPHLFSRTRDFAAGFARSLELADQLILLDIYPAREEPIPGITSAMLLDQIQLKNKQLLLRHELLPAVENIEEGVILTLGAGDIDRFVVPITQMLNETA